MDSSANVQLSLCATLKGHSGWVTSIATPNDPAQTFFVSASRDKSAIVWQVFGNRDKYAAPKRSLKGHNHFVQSVVLSNDGQYALTGSWDRTMRLYNIATGVTSATFNGHTNDVMSVAFSPDNRLIVSASRDKSIKYWNIRGELKGDFIASAGRNNQVAGHTEWVSSVTFSPDPRKFMVVSAGWDKVLKVWDFSSSTPQLNVNHLGHSGYINATAISPDGTLCASAGKDGIVMLWDLQNPRNLYSLEANSIIHALVFSPNRYWLCAATASSIKIWDLLNKTLVDELIPEFPATNGMLPECISLAWSADGSVLYSGYTDNNIRVWQVTQRS